jgi:hypothetical protein
MGSFAALTLTGVSHEIAPSCVLAMRLEDGNTFFDRRITNGTNGDEWHEFVRRLTLLLVGLLDFVKALFLIVLVVRRSVREGENTRERACFNL